MSARPDAPAAARVLQRRVLTEHLVRLTLAAPPGWTSTGVPDEWLALTPPEQFQNRYYTVRSCSPETLVLDVVVHDEGLVTAWAQTDCVGTEPSVSVAKGSFAPPADAGWVVLVGDLTALPAMARITEHVGDSLPVMTYVEAPAGTAAAYPDPPAGDVRWIEADPHDPSGLADLVAAIEWPAGPGYFWMAGESAQMRIIRTHLRRDVGMPTTHTDVMGYWSRSRGTQRRSVPLDPGPIYARGKAAGKSDEEIWADYDQARAEADQ